MTCRLCGGDLIQVEEGASIDFRFDHEFRVSAVIPSFRCEECSEEADQAEQIKADLLSELKEKLTPQKKKEIRKPHVRVRSIHSPKLERFMVVYYALESELK